MMASHPVKFLLILVIPKARIALRAVRMAEKETNKTPGSPKGHPSPIGELIVSFRHRKRLSIRGLAKEAGLSHPYLGAIEAGTTIPTEEALKKIANALALTEYDRYQLEQATMNPD